MTDTSFIYYNKGRLHIEGVEVEDLARQIGTPFYCYSGGAIVDAYRKLHEAVNHPRVKIFYAVKANSNVAVIRTLHGQGAGMDIVSAGEMARCLKAGVPARGIVFSGVGKTRDEIALALKEGIHQFNAESLPELEALSQVAGELGMTAPVALRINPDVDSGTHAKISTGKKENKFGIAWDDVEAAYARMARTPHLEAVGLSMHIGSQMTDTAPFAHAFARMEEMVKRLRAAGNKVPRVSLGGGLGIPYRGEAIPLAAFGRLVHETVQRLACEVELEPGRYLVGEAGVLISKVLYVKRGEAKNFLVIDAAMNDLIRPTLYEAYHPVGRVVENTMPDEAIYDVVGPVCETGDYLALERTLPLCQADDLVAIFCAGAYGASMASCYNSRALIPEILVEGRNFALIRPRLTIEQQLAWETMPDWL